MSKSTKDEKDTTQYEVTVLNRREITTTPRLNERVLIMKITYVGANLAPRVISIPSEEYSLEREKEVILADIEKRLSEKPERYRV